jgi:hypothetical protein
MENVFEGKWIAPRELQSNLHAKFKKRFTLDDFESAKIRISADDYYKLCINKKYIGQGPAPSYFFAQNFNEYDITSALKKGENEIEVLVYYQGLKNRVWQSGDGRVGMVADLFVDGVLFLSSDESWQYQIDNSFIESETVGYETAFLENRDLRIKCSESKTPAVVNHDYAFKKEPFPALQVYSKRVEPIKNGNTYFYDFLQEYVCNVKIKAISDESGKKIIIRCGEELDENGRVRFDMRCGVKYEESCTLDKGENIIEQFDYKAFRFLEIEAGNGIEIDAEILVRHYPFDNFEFNLKNEKLNKVLNLCKNTVLLGAQETFVDCPTREKGQYLGDVFVSGFAHYYLTKDSRLLKKAIEDFASSIDYCSRFLSVAPCSYEQEIADYALLFSNAVYKYYTLTNDTDFLKKMLPVCEFINNYYAKSEDADGLLINADKEWNLVDWPENARDGYEMGEKHCVLNAHYINSIINEERIKSALEIPFKEKSKALIESFNNAFLSKETGLFVDNPLSAHSSLHSNMLPLAFGICTDEKVADYLVQRGMQCSVFTSYFFLKALCLSGKKREALGFITSEGRHSWLNMINEGATTLFEAWGKDEKWNTSLFHPWGAAPILIYFEDLENENII